ncbi:MAG: complex I NDUFA9 subunit family protein [Hyphomicrobiales bacterium]|nr:complex I NDUFA9 subunit family protein [Hyphomicrobiales bacterium]
MTERIVTVFGGTGFLGRSVVRHLRTAGYAVRVAARHARLPAGEAGAVQAVRADIRDLASIAAAVAGAYGVVNAVSLYVEHGRDTFQSIHVDAAGAVAEAARNAGVERLVHVSGIGADAASPSHYVRKRAEGEAAVRAAFPGAVIVRPAVMFGTDGGFIVMILDLLRRLPVYPLFGRGQTRLQPVAVDDVGRAIACIVQRPEAQPTLYEFGGPDVFSYEGLLRMVAREAGLRPRFVPFPFAGWHLLARVAEYMPQPPLTRNQVELMEVDTVTSPNMPGLRELGIEPQPVAATVCDLVRAG